MRGLTVIVLILVFVVLGIAEKAQAQPADAGEFATATVHDANGHVFYVGINKSTTGTVIATIDGVPVAETDLEMPPSLGSASYRTATLDLAWTATSTEQPLPRGQLKKYEDCSATIPQVLTRDATARGTINGMPVAGTGLIGRYFYAPGASSLPHCPL